MNQLTRTKCGLDDPIDLTWFQPDLVSTLTHIPATSTLFNYYCVPMVAAIDLITAIQNMLEYKNCIIVKCNR